MRRSAFMRWALKLRPMFVVSGDKPGGRSVRKHRTQPESPSVLFVGRDPVPLPTPVGLPGSCRLHNEPGEGEPPEQNCSGLRKVIGIGLKAGCKARFHY